jgi:hypothetical protein
LSSSCCSTCPGLDAQVGWLRFRLGSELTVPGSLIPINPAQMRNRWFPSRIADYVPVQQLKILQAQGVDMQRDPTFGVRAPLEEEEEEIDVSAPRQHYVRPIEVEMLSVGSTI